MVDTVALSSRAVLGILVLHWQRVTWVAHDAMREYIVSVSLVTSI